MRTFGLTNADGQTFDLMRYDALFQHPDGIGFNRNKTFVQVENDFIRIDEKVAQKTITGQMFFLNDAAYQEFLAFIALEPLTLSYSNGGDTHYISCEISKFEKNEESEFVEICTADIDFTCLGQWYKSIEPAEVEAEEASGKIYPYTYPVTYSRGIVGSVIITNAGTMEAPLKLYIRGACSNPAWILQVNGVTIASGSVAITLSATEQLIVDSNIATLGINKCDLSRNVIADAFQQSNMSKDNFLYAPVGESELIFSQDSGAPSVTVEVYERVSTA
jgi:hypothetical protein